MKTLTEKQRKIYDFVISYLNDQGYPPTIREIGNTFEITAKGAYDHLKAIEKKGYLRCHKNLSRAIEVIRNTNNVPLLRSNDVTQVPLLGRIAAGVPVLAEENVEDYLAFPRSMLGGDALFALRVSGDSMKDAGIYDGDIAIIKKEETALEGEIIVALIEDEATLKYFYKEKDGKARLEPANDAYKPIYTSNLMILGKLSGLYRKMLS